MVTATLGPAVGRHSEKLPHGVHQQHIAIHQLQGVQRQWADRLLVLFQGKAVAGVEWSLKFQEHGLGNERFLLGLPRSQWHGIDFSSLYDQLAMPKNLWQAFQRQMPKALMLYAAFEAADNQIYYRVYLELPPDSGGASAGVHGSGYKWSPLAPDAGFVTHYREQTFSGHPEASRKIIRKIDTVSRPAIRQAAQTLFHMAAQAADPAGFMFLDATEASSSRSSFTLTFNGAEVAVQQCVPALIRLAHGLALPEGEVVRAFLPHDPRIVRSMALGRARDGTEFFTFYYG